MTTKLPQAEIIRSAILGKISWRRAAELAGLTVANVLNLSRYV